jgi:hypothetical protein
MILLSAFLSQRNSVMIESDKNETAGHLCMRPCHAMLTMASRCCFQMPHMRPLLQVCQHIALPV